MRTRSYDVRLSMKDGDLLLRAPYNKGGVEALKTQIPYVGRRWDGDNWVWRVAKRYGAVLAGIVMAHWGAQVSPPPYSKLRDAPSERLEMMELEYLGIPRFRGKETIALGWASDGWTIAFPEKVLKQWFCVDDRPEEAGTLYATLGLGQQAPVEFLRKAYRRLAKQWHPDVCKEPDANDQFLAIKNAYEVLQDPQARKRYDGGLLVARSPVGLDRRAAINWRPPLRCGWVLTYAFRSVGWTVATRIVQWDDAVNNQGQTMTTSWPPGADHFEKRWV